MSTENEIRRRALIDAAEDVCMYCGDRAKGYNTARKNKGSGNYVHDEKDSNDRLVLCLANAIWKRLEFESNQLKFNSVLGDNVSILFNLPNS